MLVRTGLGAAAIAVVLLTASGCGTDTVPLDSRPQDKDSARDLAGTVAEKADCASLEDYRLDGDGFWEFTCQRGEHAYLLSTQADEEAQRARAQKLTADGTPYRSGRYFLVYESKPEGRRTTASDLQGFPGTLKDAQS